MTILGRMRSLRSKLMWLVLTANGIALLVAGSMLLFEEVHEFRSSLVNELNTQADLLGRNSTAALEFNDPKAAAENLAQLAAQPKVLAAAIYTAKGVKFATYHLDGTPALLLPSHPRPEGEEIDWDQVKLSRRVVARGEVLGDIYLVARNSIVQRMIDFLAALGLAALGSMLVAAAIASRLQRRITGPLLSVTDVARQVMEQRNFSLRATKLTHDEVGYLVDAFNDMLAEIGQRTEAIEASRNALAKEIAYSGAT